MNYLKLLLKRPLTKASTRHALAILIIALLGFVDAAFLTVEHYRGVVPPCTTAGCDIVLTSQYSVILGIPAALLGAIYYLAILIGVFIFLEARHVSKMLKSHHFYIFKAVMIATVLGFIMSVWFTGLQAFVLGSYCLYCLGSALTSTLLFIISAHALHKNYENI